MKAHRAALLYAAAILLVLAFPILFAPRAEASTNISAVATEHFSWNDAIGWMDYYGDGVTQNVNVTGIALSGYASSSIGPISLDCATSPSGNICVSKSNYGVCNGRSGVHQTNGTCTGGEGDGNLSGYGWNDQVGWISFSCANRGIVPCSQEQVSIDSNGNFTGWAWNDTVGWISFNCSDPGVCGTSTYKVKSTWAPTSTVATLDSQVLDTQITTGATLNSLQWAGLSPNATCVNFQVAGSMTSSGPWTFQGPTGDTTSWYGALCSVSIWGGTGCAPPSTAICVNPQNLSGYRYFRYRVQLQTNPQGTSSPRIDDVILNWSR